MSNKKFKKYNKKLQRYNNTYNTIFNSYYKSAGKHWKQNLRGQLSRPTVKEIIKYIPNAIPTT